MHFDVFEAALSIIDLLLEIFAEGFKLVNFISLGTDEHLELLSLNVDIGTLLLRMLLETATFLHLCDEQFEILATQFLVRVNVFVAVLLDADVVLDDHHGGTRSPLSGIELA